jgi:CBS domain-containing protein/uncharacterized protein (DUF2267 family)
VGRRGPANIEACPQVVLPDGVFTSCADERARSRPYRTFDSGTFDSSLACTWAGGEVASIAACEPQLQRACQPRREHQCGVLADVDQARPLQRGPRMSLEQYCGGAKRLVVQSADVSAYDAVRALSANHIGAVIVEDKGRVVGIVTDRDLACRTIGADLDPRQTRLHDVMSPGPVTIPIDATEEQAARLMRARHVRRLPIVDGVRAAGIVTLDDLLLTGAVNLDEAAQIVESQLAEPAPLKPPGVIHPIRTHDRATKSPRGESHARQTLQAFQARLRTALGILDPHRALAAFDVVASGLVRRVTPGEALDFASQLPLSIQDRLLERPAGPDPSVTSDTIIAEMASRLEIDNEDAERIVRRVTKCLTEFVSVTEVSNLVEQLPADMKQMFPEG